MTRHQKRLSVPNSWPVERKEGTFTVKAGAGPHGEQGVPLLVVLRDVLEYVDSKKEARYALGQDSVLVNGQPVSDEQRPIGMFDILAFLEREEYYRVFPDEGGRLSLTAIDADAADSRLGKVTGKQQVPGGETQLALHDGTTLVTDDEDVTVNDSVVVSNDETDVVAHFPYEEGALVTAVAGAHAGDIGTIDEIQVTASSSPNNVLVDSADGDGRFETVEEYVVVIDENFTGGSSSSSETAESTEAEDSDSEPSAESEEAESSSTGEETDAESSEDEGEAAEGSDEGGDEQ